MSASIGAMILTIDSAWDVTVEDDSVTVHTKVAEGSYIDVVLSLTTLSQIQSEVRVAQKEKA